MPAAKHHSNKNIHEQIVIKVVVLQRLRSQKSRTILLPIGRALRLQSLLGVLRVRMVTCFRSDFPPGPASLWFLV